MFFNGLKPVYIVELFLHIKQSGINKLSLFINKLKFKAFFHLLGYISIQLVNLFFGQFILPVPYYTWNKELLKCFRIFFIILVSLCCTKQIQKIFQLSDQMFSNQYMSSRFEKSFNINIAFFVHYQPRLDFKQMCLHQKECQV